MSTSTASGRIVKERQMIETSEGLKLDATVYSTGGGEAGGIAAVLVHPYSLLGGRQTLMSGIARSLLLSSSLFFSSSVTFDSRGAGYSTGTPSLTGSSEVSDVISVCRWVVLHLRIPRILLVGSSAGAPIAGSAVDQVDEVIGYVSIGYPFGFMSSILFGGHHKAILKSPKPKLFVMGTRDGFTSVKQLENKLKSASGRVETHLIEGASHFQMEGPTFDAQMAGLIEGFVGSLLNPPSSTLSQSIS